MAERIERLFDRCRDERRAAFIAYICAGDPNFARTVEIAFALEKAGADLLELGIPFSDPLADGVVNQLAAQRALEAGATVPGVLECVRQIRRHSEIPIVLYTYLNPILCYGVAGFEREAALAGVDGLLILDLPSEEDRNIYTLDRSKASSAMPAGHKIAKDKNLLRIRLIAPTTSLERMSAIATSARGFIYYVSREGVTGVRGSIPRSLDEKIALIRKHSKLPIAVGFGISNPAQAAQVARLADAVVVGSAIVDLIAKSEDGPHLTDRIADFVREIAAAVHRAREA